MAAPDNPLRAAFPTGPLLDAATRLLTPAWRAFFMSLYNRTGAVDGTSVTNAVGAEAAVRAQADADIAATAHAETVALGDALVREATARTAADGALQATMLPLTGGTLSGPLAAPAAVFGVVATGTLNTTWTAGAAAPTASATEGSLYSRQGGGAGAHLYICQGGTVWLPVAAA